MNGKRVLLVEDNGVTLDAVGSLLTADGCTVDLAGNGHGALTRLALHKPNVIVMDHYMPGMDGITFLRKFRANPLWAHIPVILTTAAGDADVEQLAEIIAREGLGPVTWLRKPFEPAVLIDLLRGVGRAGKVT